MLLGRLRQNIKFALLVRSLCADGVSKENIWITTQLQESLLLENPYVVCFFSCITALSEGNH